MANLKTVSKKSKAQSMGMHTEVLTGRTQQKFFNPDEAENFYYFGTYDVDFNKRTDLDVKDMTAAEANKKIDGLMSEGYGTIVIKNPQGKHSLGVGILNKLNLIFEVVYDILEWDHVMVQLLESAEELAGLVLKI